MRFRLAVSLLVLCLAIPLQAKITPLERQQVAKVLGTTGKYVADEDTYKFAFPREDIKVLVQGWQLPSFMGLESSAAFIGDPHHGGSLLVAELALLEDEVNPVVSAALDNGLAVTSIGNNYIFEEPRILFMHVCGLGEPVALAAKLQKLRQTIKTVRADNATPSDQFVGDGIPLKSNLDASVLNSILMTHGQGDNGMYKASMGMVGTIFGVPAGKQVGLRTWIAFAGTNENAIVDGQIIMSPKQVRNVLRALRRSGIYVTALHNHFIDSNPEFYFVHFWGRGSARVLALSIRRAMETQLR